MVLRCQGDFRTAGKGPARPRRPRFTGFQILRRRRARWEFAFECLSFQATGTGYTGLECRYDLENRTNLLLGNWVPIIDYTNLVGDNSEVVHTNATPQRIYYRSRARLRP